MKKLLLSSSLAFWVSAALGQGTVDFSNNTATRVMNRLTGGPVVAQDGLAAALYWAPLSDPNNFFQLGNSVLVGERVPGFFIGGTRTTGPMTAPGEEGRFVVRAWELAYGSSFEAALAGGFMNGRPSLIYESYSFTLTTGGAGIPPTTPASLLGTTANPGFLGLRDQCLACPEPSSGLLGVIAVVGGLLFHRYGHARKTSRKLPLEQSRLSV